MSRAPSGASDAVSPSTSVPCSMASSSSSTVDSASTATTTVVPSQRCGTSASTSAPVNVRRSASGHSSRPNSTPGSSAASTDGERTEQLLEPGEHLVDLLLELLGYDDLVAVPHVGDLGLGERLGQLGPLVDRPAGHVVVDLDGLRIVGVPVEHGSRRYWRQLPFTAHADLSSRRPDRNLAMELVRVTESAALAASRWVGRGDKNGADGAAVAAMRTVLSTVTMDGVVVIGEGEKDQAPMLFNGEQVGDGTPPLVDVAVDPIDGTTLTAQGRTNALSVIAVSERESMFDPGPSVYMEKIAVGPDAVGSIDITATPTQNLRWIAKAKRESVRDLTVVILDRPRHSDLIDEVRASGARIRLITDGDVYGSIAAGSPGSRRRRADGCRRHARRRHPAAALKCMGGEIQGRLWPRRRRRAGVHRGAGLDVAAVLTIDDLVRSDDCFFAATGITDGPLLDGVRFDARGVTTQSLVMRSRSGTVRRIDAHHQLAKLSEFSEVDYN